MKLNAKGKKVLNKLISLSLEGNLTAIRLYFDVVEKLDAPIGDGVTIIDDIYSPFDDHDDENIAP